jgi:hypothetical protein
MWFLQREWCSILIFLLETFKFAPITPLRFVAGQSFCFWLSEFGDGTAHGMEDQNDVLAMI